MIILFPVDMQAHVAYSILSFRFLHRWKYLTSIKLDSNKTALESGVKYLIKLW